MSFVLSYYSKHEQEGFAVAWVAALKRPNGTNHHRQARHIYILPSDVILRVCIHALQAWDGFTSSEIERGFRAIMRTLGKQRGIMVDDCWALRTKLMEWINTTTEGSKGD